MHTVTVAPNPLVIYRGARDDAEMAYRAVLKILQRQGLSPDAAKINPYGARLWTVGFYGDDDAVKDAYSVYKDAFGNDFWNECAASPDGWVNPMSIQVHRVAKESKNEGAIVFDTPSFKPRKYEGEYILYTLYGLDSDGDELDNIITSPKKSTVIHTIKELLPDYGRVYNGMHVVAILYDKNDRRLDSEVVWSTDQNEANGADETIEFEKGHKNSRGENAPWVIRDHKNGKVLASFAKKGDAEAHLERMKRYSKNENSVMDWANEIKDAVANAAKAAGLENRIVASATNMPKLFVDVYQIGIMGDGINWEITGNLGVRRFDHQDVKRHWRVDGIEELEKSLTDEFQQLKSGKFIEETKGISGSDLPARLKAAGRVVADNRLGRITKARLRDNTLAFYPLEDDGKDDDCIYFFKLDGNDIVTKGYQWGRDKIDYYMIAEDGYPWTVEPGRPTRDYVHTKKYAKYLLDRVRKCLDLGVVTEKRGAGDAEDHLERMKHYKKEEDLIQTYLMEVFIFNSLKETDGYELNCDYNYNQSEAPHRVEITKGKFGAPMDNLVGKAIEYLKDGIVNNHGVKIRWHALSTFGNDHFANWSYDGIHGLRADKRVEKELAPFLKKAEKGRHERLFNVKELEDYAMKGYKAAVMAAWSAAGVRNFKIDIQQNSRNIDILPKTLDGNDIDVSWRIVPEEDKVFQYADDLTTGNSEIEREMDFLSDDDLETIFTEEFKTLDETIADGEI